jgi:GMP synthase (glutamine-hydrolysing)
MKLLLVHNLEPEDVVFNQPLESAISPHTAFDSVFYTNIPSLELIEANYNCVIVSGVPIHYSVDTIDSRMEQLDWIRHVRIPVLGICLGHQNIGRLFGSALFIGEEAEDGLVSLQTVGNDDILRDISTGVTVRAYHSCSISLPDDFVLIASTDACRNQLMKHKDRDIYSAQFHPELSVGEAVKIIENFVGIGNKKRKIQNDLQFMS